MLFSFSAKRKFWKLIIRQINKQPQSLAKVFILAVYHSLSLLKPQFTKSTAQQWQYVTKKGKEETREKTKRENKK